MIKVRCLCVEPVTESIFFLLENFKWVLYQTDSSGSALFAKIKVAFRG